MKAIITLLIVVLVNSMSLKAQNLLNQPEHVTYDSVHQRYLVTNYGNGNIISIDLEGNQQVAISGITKCLGIHIVDTVIYVSAGKNLYSFDYNTFEAKDTFLLNVFNWVDGMIDDGNGHLFLAENSGKVHKFNLTSHEDEIIVSSGLPQYPQDLAYDRVTNRLFLVSWAYQAPIVAIDLKDNSVTNIIETNSGSYDGIVIDTAGNLYVTSWLFNGRVYEWEKPYTGSPVIQYEGLSGPAGLFLDIKENKLIVPNFNGNSLSYISITEPTTMIKNIEKKPITIKKNILCLSENYPSEVIISDALGKIVFRKYFPKPENINLESTLSKYNRGIYFISVCEENQIYTAKYFKN